VGTSVSLLGWAGVSQAAPPGSRPAASLHASEPVGRTTHFLVDFNGDGYGDLAVGVYREGVGEYDRAGAVSVIYGSATGLQATGTGGPDDQFWTQDAPGISGDGPQQAGYFGHTLAYGDFNGDGYTDLAIGAYGQDLGVIVDAGEVYVLYGSSCGLQADPAICGGPDDQFWTQDSPGMNSDGAEAFDEFGHYLIAADFNGDGFAELAIGASEDVGTIEDAGAASVLYGTALGLQADGSSGPDDQFWTQDSPSVKDQAEKGDGLGQSLGAGDFNADGFADLVMPVFLESLPGAAHAGAVNVLYGSTCGLQADPAICGGPDDQFWTQNSPDVNSDGAERDDWFGRSPAAGDFNGDGFDDLALGAEQEDVGVVEDAGSMSVLYGSAAGLQAVAPDDQFWTQDSPGVLDQAETGDFMGRAVRAVDFNGDGYADLAFSAFREDLDLLADGGLVNVLYGSSCGLQADPTCGNLEDQIWTQDSSGVLDQAEANDQFGKNLGFGDFNADGYGDLAVGVWWEDLNVMNAGLINVLYGSACGLQASVTCENHDDQIFAQGKAGLLDKGERYDGFGWFS
jgi:FG-GAP repeat protein